MTRKKKPTGAPYVQRCVKIITTETKQEAETILNSLFQDCIQEGEVPDVQVYPHGDGFTLVIFADVIIGE